MLGGQESNFQTSIQLAKVVVINLDARKKLWSLRIYLFWSHKIIRDHISGVVALANRTSEPCGGG